MEVLRRLSDGKRFVIASLPTGSGKTVIEMLVAFHTVSKGAEKVLVLEPTRFLCDQMSSRGKRGGPWVKLFGNIVGMEYEGECHSFIDPRKKIVVATPQTTLKCSELLKPAPEAVIIDEVHHAFGGKHYAELLTKLKPNAVVGFTALLPTRRLYRLDPRVKEALGNPHVMAYDFRELRKIDPDFKPPKAIVDLFDAELNKAENRAYDKLFRALVGGASATLKFLEVTLARYGKNAFCESYLRALNENKISPDDDLNALCRSNEPSHKARALIDALTIYDIKGNEEIKPALIFTSRKATASEFREAIVNYLGLPPERVGTLTSDLSKEERQELVEKVKAGEVDVIVSTLVGEEGVDIPEAGLLVMTDVPKSPLRFYQRLGRLIRTSSPHRIKYLVVSLTPKTIEYYDLEDALWRLYAEGVDVSYILVNVKGMDTSTRILNTLNTFAKAYEGVSIPYTLLTLGQELGNPLNFIVNLIKGREECIRTIREVAEKELGMQTRGDEELEEVVFRILTSFMLRDEKVRKALKPLDDAVRRSRFEKEFTRAVRDGKVLYVYDVDILADIISRRLRELRDTCLKNGKGVVDDRFFRIDRKSLLRLLTRAFPHDSVNDVLSELKARLRRCEEYLRVVKGRNDDSLTYLVSETETYNSRAKSLTCQLGIRVKLGDVTIILETQVNYYDINAEIIGSKDFIELIRTNLRVARCEALRRFLEKLHENTMQ